MRKFLSTLLFVLLSPLMLVVLAGYLCALPFLVAFYKRSPWYRDLKEAYSWGVTSTAYYKIYNMVSKADLPVEHLAVGGYHLFFCDRRVLFSPADYVEELYYDEDAHAFSVLKRDGEKCTAETLDGYMEDVLFGLSEVIGQRELWLAVSEGDCGNHVKEGRALFGVYADQSELKMLLEAFCHTEEGDGTFLAEEE